MASKLFSKHFKRNILKYTVAFSAAVHLIAFYLLPTWNTLPTHEREKIIKIKYVQENKVTTEEKIFLEPKKKAVREMFPQKKTAEIKRINLRPKSAIINIEMTNTHAPRLSFIRSPVPIRNSKEIFKPVNTAQEHAPFPHPVSELKNRANLESLHAMRPVPHMRRIGSQDQEAPVALLTKAILLNNSRDSFKKINHINSIQPTLQITNTSSFAETTFLRSSVQIKYFTEVSFKDHGNATFLASSKSDKILIPLKFSALQKHQPLELKGNSLTHQLVPEMKITGPVQTANIQARVPKSLDSDSVARRYRPAIPMTASYFSSPLRSARLLQEASIPSSFSEEKLASDEELSNRGSARVASLRKGVAEVSTELLRKIQEGFSSQVWTRIAQAKYYPRIARKRGFEGQPVVAFTLGNKGKLLEVSIANPSPFKLLDEAALDAVKSASPYPPIPQLLKMESIKFKLPISFTLVDR